MSSDGYFAFASIRGVFCLVLGKYYVGSFRNLIITNFPVSYATPPSALTTIDVQVFRHEFINIFRFSENRTLHPDDINIIEHIADNGMRYEEDNETVVLAQVLMERMRKHTDPRRTFSLGVGSRKVASPLSGPRTHTQGHLRQ